MEHKTCHVRIYATIHRHALVCSVYKQTPTSVQTHSPVEQKQTNKQKLPETDSALSFRHFFVEVPQRARGHTSTYDLRHCDVMTEIVPNVVKL